MAEDPFTFDQKTGEIQRAGKIVPLCRLHANIFALYNNPGRILTNVQIARNLNIKPDDVSYAVRCMKKRLRRIGLDLTAAHRSRGRILVVNPMPKWAPTIPPAVAMEDVAS